MKSSLVLLLTSTVFCFHQIPDDYTGVNNRPAWTRHTAPTPQFEATSSSILSHVGQNITLPCRVRNLAEQTVSWIRTSELSILTSNIFTFTSDERFSVQHPDGDSAAWGLRITGVRLEDAGEYECQVSTFPKLRHTVRLTVKGKVMFPKLGHTVRLTVKDISMNSDGFEENILRDSPPSGSDSTKDLLQVRPKHQVVPLGSVTSLSCSMSLLDEPLAFSEEKDLPVIRWRHNGTGVSLRNHSKLSPSSSYSIGSEVSAEQLLSRLIISNVSWEAGGVYECIFNDLSAESELFVTSESYQSLPVNLATRLHLHYTSLVYLIFLKPILNLLHSIT
uniref:Ig-like domain-containing protein n=1 Tax=Cacopsylla melanoneura TaxID=428564 RepID=A0A8D8QJE9_9HEMI